MLNRSRKNSRRVYRSHYRLAPKFLFSFIFGVIIFGLIIINVVPILSTVKSARPQARTLASDLGINNSGYNTDLAYIDRSIKHTKDLGLGIVRMGMDGVGGKTEGASFNWSARDKVVKKYLNAGIKIHSPLSARGHVDRDENYAQWKANYRYFVRNVMRHYKGKISYYIIDNEPDLDYGNGTMSAQQCVDMTKIAYEAAKSIDPNIKIESPPPKGIDSPILDEMLKRGIAKYSDYIGMHAYGGQIHEGNLGRPWDVLAANKVRKPIAISEAGAIASWCEGSDAEKEDCRARWFAEFGQRLKRFGYDHALLFDLEGSGEGWSLAPNFQPTKAYQQIKNMRLNQALANTGFESKNNVKSDWVPFNGDDIGASPYVTFVQGDASGAHSGKGYVKLESGKADSTTPINVRRIAGQLPRGKKVAIGAWVYVNGNQKATLKALGYDNRNGTAEIAKTSTKKNAWQYLEIAVPISKNWATIELGTEGTGSKGDYVKWDDVVVRTS